MTAMSAWECAMLLKCSTTVESSVLWCVMLKRWLLILQCNSCPVSPNILFATPPAHDEVYNVGRLTGGPHSGLKLFTSAVTGELIHGKQYGTGLASRRPGFIVARQHLSWWFLEGCIAILRRCLTWFNGILISVWTSTVTDSQSTC